MERGGQRVHFGRAGVSKGSFTSPQKAVVLEVGSAFTRWEDEAKHGEAFFPCWQPLIRGKPLVSQPGAGLLPSQRGQAGSLCALLQVSIKVFSISSAHLKS